ncbi:DoxX family protein [Catenuloplanes indicus]|uniref:Membrane protein n=1 Tax=Catenuloplanes indicus TaxID=137267 RepID=A0AAE3W7T2_9ACTN|nr:hypothetical protein [Catenuloplanes indicus]MDQ0370872.1 putative membrane protein [Catenuloplanes indicus]
MLGIAGQILLGLALIGAGIGHLTVLRAEFQAQVPSWVPLDADFVVVASGVVEVVLGLALLLAWRQPVRGLVGAVVAAFFVVIFPGNVAQFTEQRDAFGLESDLARGVRLLFQPLLVVWALAATGAIPVLRTLLQRSRRSRRS